MNNYIGKTIMILGAGHLQVPILQCAKEKGLRVVVVSPGKDDPGFAYADAIVPLDVRDEEGILAAAKEYGIDGITTDQTDLPVRTAAYVAEKLGLPGIGYDMGCLFTNKYRQREVCAKAGLPVPKFQMVHTVQEAEAFFEACGGIPMIIKPIDSQASRGVSKVTHPSQIKAAFEDAVGYTRTGDVLMEEWICGDEFSVDSVVIDSKIHMLSIGQYHPFNIPEAFSSACTFFPAHCSEEYAERIIAANEKVIRAFGYKDGRTHAEFLVSDKSCTLVEIGARGGGSYFSSDNVRFASGFCTEEYLIDFALGIPRNGLPLSSERHNYTCTLFFFLPENGTVVDISAIKSVESYEFVRRNNLYQINVGLKTRPSSDKAARFFMVLVADNPLQLQQRITMVRDTLKIITETTNGKRLPPIWG